MPMAGSRGRCENEGGRGREGKKQWWRLARVASLCSICDDFHFVSVGSLVLSFFPFGFAFPSLNRKRKGGKKCLNAPRPDQPCASISTSSHWH